MLGVYFDRAKTNSEALTTRFLFLRILLLCDFLSELLCFFVRVGAVHATEGGVFSIDDFSVASFVDFAAAVGADVKAWLNRDRDGIGEALEKTSAKFSAFLGELEDFSFFFTYWLFSVLYQAFFF